MNYDFGWTCDRRALKSALDRLKKTFGSGNTIQVLNNVEVTPDPFNGGAMLRVTDMETYHSVPVPGACSGDRLMVDFRQLQKVVDSLPDGGVTIRGDAPAPIEMHEVTKSKCDASTGWESVPYTVTEAKPRPPQKVLGTLGKKTFSLFRWDHTGEGNVLPDPPSCFPGFPCVTRELDLAALLAPVLHAVATDDSRYGLNGAQLEFYPDGSVGAVSTDGHRAVAHRIQMLGTEATGPLLPLGFSKNIKDTARGMVTLTWWQPSTCGGSLQGLATMDQHRLREGTPQYRVHFDLGEDSRTVVRGHDLVQVKGANRSYSQKRQEKVEVITDQDPRTATCTVRTSPETLALLLQLRVPPNDWLALPDVTVSGDASHLLALCGEIERSSVVRVEHPDGTVLVARCLAGEFPYWRQIIPQRFLREAVVDRKALDEAVKYVMTAASEKTHCVRVSLRDGSVLLHASNPDTGEMSDEVPAETSGDLTIEVVSGKSDSDEKTRETRPFVIGLSGSYIRDELRILDGERIELQFGDVLNVVILRRPGDDSLMSIVMPMRLK